MEVILLPAIFKLNGMLKSFIDEKCQELLHKYQTTNKENFASKKQRKCKRCKVIIQLDIFHQPLCLQRAMMG